MTNYKQPGQTMEYANAGSAISSGAVVQLVDRVGIALANITATTGTGSVALSGVFAADKDGDEAFAQGDWLYYDSGDGTFTKTAAGNMPAGIAFEAAASSDVVCRIQLCPHPKRAAVVAYSAGSNLPGASCAGAGSPSATNVNSAIDTVSAAAETRLDAIDTAIAAIITSLKNAGLMKNA